MVASEGATGASTPTLVENVMGETKVSVVIPTIGRRSLRRAVESVLAQCGDMEPIVVVDKIEALESVATLLEDLDCLVVPGLGLGAGAARNTGLAMATGEYIGFLDDDDYWLPAKVSLQISEIQKSGIPERTIAVGQTRLVSRKGRVSRSATRPYDPAQESLANYLVKRTRLLYGNTYFSGCSILGSAGLIRSIPWDPSLPRHQDWDLFIRYSQVEDVQFVQVHEPVVVVQQGSPGSISLSRSWRESALFLAKHGSLISGRARTDFVLLNMLAPALRSRDLAGICASLSFVKAPPHLGATARFLLGAMSRR